MDIYNPYAILEIPETASNAQLKAAFQQKIAQTHPDLHNNDPALAARFQDALDAYVFLADPARRQLYRDYVSSGSQENLCNLFDFAKFRETTKRLNFYIQQMYGGRATNRKLALTGIFVGLGLAAFGVGFTVLSYQFASPGSRYVICYGAVLCGIVSLFKGLRDFSRLGKDAAYFETQVWSILRD